MIWKSQLVRRNWKGQIDHKAHLLIFSVILTDIKHVHTNLLPWEEWIDRELGLMDIMFDIFHISCFFSLLFFFSFFTQQNWFHLRKGNVWRSLKETWSFISYLYSSIWLCSSSWGLLSLIYFVTSLYLIW